MNQTLIEPGSLLWYPTVERILQLEGLQVPPPKYDTFLAEAVDTFVNFVIGVNGVQSLDEVVAKSKAELAQVNPDKTGDEIDRFVGAPVELSFSGQLRYFRPSGDRVPNRVYESGGYTEDLFNPHGGVPIKFGSHAEGLAVVVQKITEELGRRYPDTQGALPDNFLTLPKAAEVAPISSLIRGFDFTLHLRSNQTGYLEVDVSLTNCGGVSRDGEEQLGDVNSFMAIPGIHITTKILRGSLGGLQTLTDRLAGLVSKHYQTKATEYRQSFSTDIVPKRKLEA